MRISVPVLILICAGAMTLSAASSKAQGALDKPVTIDVRNQPLGVVLDEVAAQVKVNFTYGDNVIFQTKLNYKAEKERLGTLLDRLLKDYPYRYTVVDDDVILTYAPEKLERVAVLPPVTGKVVDEKGQPLPGATVKVKGTAIAVVTDKEGVFHLQPLDKGTVLVISFIGYQAQEVQVGSGESLNIVLLLSSSKLDEVVIIPYGTTTQRLSTGSITKVTAKEIENQPVSNFLETLSGRVPGLIITQSNGVPGSNFKVQLEGQNALGIGNAKNSVNSDPLIVIDGVPFASNNNIINQISSAASPKSSMGISPLNSLNPTDIESIEVLKDADATAIYGSRGAYGVILITTKKGKAGKTEVNASVYSGYSNVTRTVDLINTPQYLSMRKEAFANDAIIPDATNAPDLINWDQNKYTDWKKVFIGNTAHSSDAQVSVSGGNQNTQFLVGGNYHDESTVLPGDNGDKRTSLHFNINQTSENKRFNINLTGGFTSEVNNILKSDLTSQTLLPPNYPDLFDGNGNLVWQYSNTSLALGNPLSYTKASYIARTENLNANLITSYLLCKGLTLKASIGYNNIRFGEISISPISSQDPQYAPLGGSDFGNNVFRAWIIEPQLTYNKVLGKGTIYSLLGGTFQETTNNSDYLSTYGYTSDNLLQSVGGATSLSATNTSSQYRYTAIFGRVTYNLLDKYIINLSGRRDGSSRFGSGKQFGNFGAIGAAWLFTNEAFISKNLSFLSFGKLRTSYGTTGSDQIPNYQYLDSWTNTTNSYSGVAGLYPTKLVNKDFSWEVNKKLSAAVELGFFKDRVLLSSTYFTNRSSNHLISSILPTQTGFTAIIENFPAIIQNNGWEFTINTQNIKSKFLRWTSYLNLTIPKNKLVSFPGIANSSYSGTYVVGESLNIIRGYEYLGVDEATGVFKIKDQNNDNVYNAFDIVSLGTFDPKFYGGFQNSLSFHKFTLDLFLEFRKQTGLNYLSSIYSNTGATVGFLKNIPAALSDRWQKVGDMTPFEKYSANYGTSASNAAILFASASSGLYTDASFIRLKNASLAYNLPETWLKKVGIKNGQLYLRGQNLLTITNYKGSDPETQSLVTLPPLRTIVAGIQFNL